MSIHVSSSEEIQQRHDVCGEQLRSRIRTHWRKITEPLISINVPALAREATELFYTDPQFQDCFYDAFLYDIIYDMGVHLLSQDRRVVDMEGYGDLSRWFEFDPDGDRHVRLTEMSLTQIEEAIARRERKMAYEQERIELLRELANKKPYSAQQRKAKETHQQQEEKKNGVVSRGTVTIEGEKVVSITQEFPPSGQDVFPEEEETKPKNPQARCLHCLEIFNVPKYFFEENCRDLATMEDEVCPTCLQLYPPALLKAAVDPFDYALRLTTGELMYFGSCGFRGEWVCLKDVRQEHVADIHGDLAQSPHPYPSFDRGVDVRLSAIVWVADAPFGS